MIISEISNLPWLRAHALIVELAFITMHMCDDYSSNWSAEQDLDQDLNCYMTSLV